MPEIGATLREARMRARIDLSEVEAQTKIRARYLRALENEEWDVLPGPTFTRSFLRTYAAALGLDGKTLVEEYRREYELPGEAETVQPLAPRQRRLRRHRPGDPVGISPGGRPSRGYLVTVALVGLVIVLLLIGLIAQGSSKPKAGGGSPRRSQSANRAGGRHRNPTGNNAHRSRQSSTQTSAQSSEQVKVYLQASETVWVCLLNEAEEKLVPGVDMQAGETSGPYASKRFDLTLGNNHVTLRVDGKAVEVPESTTAIGYEITKGGATSLPPGSQPTCG